MRVALYFVPACTYTLFSTLLHSTPLRYTAQHSTKSNQPMICPAFTYLLSIQHRHAKIADPTLRRTRARFTFLASHGLAWPRMAWLGVRRIDRPSSQTQFPSMSSYIVEPT
jgi:hypothetical protein